MKERRELAVLALLKESGGSFVSGQRMSEAIGISRTAVWKHISGLRKQGYKIESAPSKGYRLAPGASPVFNATELSLGLETDFIGKEIHFFDSVDSTNREAVRLAASGAPEGAVVVADTQSGGKGRLGREWFSPPGSNLYLSIILRPSLAPPAAPALTLVAAVAVAVAIAAYIPRRPSVKWPNDIMIDSSKVAGILTEMSSETDRVNHIVCGIGVNLNSAPGGRMPTGGYGATSLKAESGEEVPRADFTRTLFKSMERWYRIFLDDGLGDVLEAWKSFFEAVGKPVTVDTIDRRISGLCMGIDRAGALLVRDPAGEIISVTSGDMSV